MTGVPLSLFALTGWIVLAALVACLPMRLQYPPGLTLLLLAPPLIVWLALDHGLLLAAFGLFAFGSMFRRPLRHLLAKARGTT